MCEIPGDNDQLPQMWWCPNPNFKKILKPGDQPNSRGRYVDRLFVRKHTAYYDSGFTSDIQMTPGTFAVFFPGQAHLPGIKTRHDQARLAVIKINLDFLNRL